MNSKLMNVINYFEFHNFDSILLNLKGNGCKCKTEKNSWMKLINLI